MLLIRLTKVELANSSTMNSINTDWIQITTISPILGFPTRMS
ncbi:hypothetical protein MAR_007392 [Mya arenaria]|uniref:Uncharacterized protein n=1 Tax=Mya arenaria TaxID=6604 RepID=A0ABY7DB64_MYAAR|nr:hypothetical protein MAR_007392 [Mya arenaria]